MMKYSALLRYAFDLRGAPFAWGINDCNMIVYRALTLMTGTDHHSWRFGKYTDFSSARRFEREHAADLRKYVEGLGWRNVYPEPMQFGDVILRPEYLRSRFLWWSGAIYLAKQHALVADSTTDTVRIVDIETMPAFDVVLRSPA